MNEVHSERRGQSIGNMEDRVLLYCILAVVVSREESDRERRESYYETSCFGCLLFIDLERKRGAVSKLRRDSVIESTVDSGQKETLAETID